MPDVIKNEISTALNDVEGLVHVDVPMNRDTYANQNLLRTKHQTVGPTEGTNLDEEIAATLNKTFTIMGTKHIAL